MKNIHQLAMVAALTNTAGLGAQVAHNAPKSTYSHEPAFIGRGGRSKDRNSGGNRLSQKGRRVRARRMNSN